jgi:hypothetical protein
MCVNDGGDGVRRVMKAIDKFKKQRNADSYRRKTHDARRKLFTSHIHDVLNRIRVRLAGSWTDRRCRNIFMMLFPAGSNLAYNRIFDSY